MEKFRSLMPIFYTTWLPLILTTFASMWLNIILIIITIIVIGIYQSGVKLVSKQGSLKTLTNRLTKDGKIFVYIILPLALILNIVLLFIQSKNSEKDFQKILTAVEKSGFKYDSKKDSLIRDINKPIFRGNGVVINGTVVSDVEVSNVTYSNLTETPYDAIAPLSVISSKDLVNAIKTYAAQTKLPYDSVYLLGVANTKGETFYSNITASLNKFNINVAGTETLVTHDHVVKKGISVGRYNNRISLVIGDLY
ncbi:MAG TPA: hypothetical protein VHM26_10675 [Chitinophagaceae bacterium]|jgi:hypothetical protein|nr:hypothetical protein [Chitinophagaceae bacterium]